MSAADVQTISIETWKQWTAARKPALLVDVRSATEFAAGHLPGAVNIPLEQIELRRADLDSAAPIVLVCQGGTRARCAHTLLTPTLARLVVLDGGTDGWARAGNPIVRNTPSRWSLERQVRLAAGLLVMLGTVLSLVLWAWWLGLPAFIGCGLTFAGLTGICPMGDVLARLPWNCTRRSPGTAAQPSYGLSCACESAKRP